jgi:hypothetical protein
LQVPGDLLLATSRHSIGTMPSTQKDDFAAWIELLPTDRKNEYLLRLAHNESGLSRLFVRELRELNQDKNRVRPSTGERVTYATLNSESKIIKAQREREKLERERAEHLRRLQYIHNHQEQFWQEVDQAVKHTVGARYDDAVRNLVNLREAADQFNETREFQERFGVWVQPYMRRPALVERLRLHKFALP